MSIDLSAATAAEMKINRLFLTDAAALVLEDANADSGYIPLVTLDQTADWDAQDVLNTQNKDEYYVVRVLDYSGFEAFIRKAATIKLEGYRYKIEKVYPPKGATRVWTIRCTHNGERIP